MWSTNVHSENFKLYLLVQSTKYVQNISSLKQIGSSSKSKLVYSFCIMKITKIETGTHRSGLLNFGTLICDPQLS